MKSKIEINISVIDDGPVVMRCQGQNTSKGKALDALEDAYLSTVAQLMRKDLSKAEQEEAAKEFGEMMQEKLRDSASERKIFQLPRSSYLGMVSRPEDGNSFSHSLRKTQK